MELLLGAGSRRDKLLYPFGGEDWTDLVTCDIVASHRPDVVCDLNHTPWPFASGSMSEIHAYECLEHLGTQGDWRAFFDQFGEIWRILAPGGYVAGTCPSWRSEWAWADPSHTRVITAGTLAFLSRAEYRRQVGLNPMSDFTSYWHHSFAPVLIEEDEDKLLFVLRKEADEQS